VAQCAVGMVRRPGSSGRHAHDKRLHRRDELVAEFTSSYLCAEA
jgi:hypothetical protein